MTPMMASHQPRQRSDGETLLQEVDDLYRQLTSSWSKALNFKLFKGASDHSETYDLSKLIGKKVAELGWPPSTKPVEIQRPHRLYFDPNLYPPPKLDSKGLFKDNCTAFNQLKQDLEVTAHSS